MKLLIFVGAGSSVEMGVPAMRKMAEQLLDHLRECNLSKDILNILQTRFKDPTFDIENIIEDTDALSIVHSIGPSWGMNNNIQHSSEISIIRMEAEWFVQHICEQVGRDQAKALWVPSIRAFAKHDVSIATTNYDRAIEIAASSLNVDLNDGFENFAEQRFAQWKGVDGIAGLKLLKLHGSTDWYRTSDQTVYKLRHPMSLYGDIAVQVDDLTFRHAIILPSREKRITEFPYQTLMFEFQKLSTEADVAIFVGTSLRDPHLLTICNQCADRMPTIVTCVDEELIPSVIRKKVIIVTQCASHFLVSSLPVALRNENVDGFQRAMECESTHTESILQSLIAVFDIENKSHERLIAIDVLCKVGVALDLKEINKLLTDNDKNIRTYALGLIQDSPDCDELLGNAIRMAIKEKPNSDFKTETELLERLIALT